MKKIVTLVYLSAMFFPVFSQNKSGENYLIVGTYTSGKSEGIYVYTFNSNTGDVTPVSVAKGISNPSYLIPSPDGKYVYAVNENGNEKNSGGSVTALSFDKKTGILTKLNEQPSGGNHPCYIAIDKSGKWVAAGNYSSGTFSIFPVSKNGTLGAATDRIQHEGHGVDTQRQQGPHVHATVFSKDNRFLFVSDLGLDKIMIYNFNKKSGKLSPATIPYIETEPGTGPRHLDFSPDNKYAYLIEEMSGGISVYRYKGNGQLELIQNISALPPDYIGSIGSADIHVSPDGKFLYASNRGESNTIAIFSINSRTGELSVVGYQPVLGKGPRNFNFDPSGNFLLVANQYSDSIVIFKRDKQTGLLTDTGKGVEVGTPVCIKWISK